MANTVDTLLRRPLYVYDLPPEILSTLTLKSSPVLTQDPTIAIEETPPRSKAVDTTSLASASCLRCQLSFATWQEQRNHFKSDFHGYNSKLNARGLSPVTESDFDKLVDGLNESISGSDSSETEDDDNEDAQQAKNGPDMLTSLLKKQAKLHDSPGLTEAPKKRKRGSGAAPLLWFTSSKLPSNTSLGVYRAIFTNGEQERLSEAGDLLRDKQLVLSKPGLDQNPTDGGVNLPKPHLGPHIFLCMIGGGHFAGMIVSLTPKIGKKQGFDERQASVIAHKTFHRYTTRRKQGGAQSTSDSANGAAHSAGSSLRRYNETALTDEIRVLLKEWKQLIDDSELLFIRATGTTNRKTLFGPYEDQVLRQDDPRIRGFPFSTRRATQAELMRSFVELTRVKVSEIDEVALAAAAKAEEASRQAQLKAQENAAAQKAASRANAIALSHEEEVATLHTTQLESLIRRSRAPALLTYLTTNALSPDFEFFPYDSRAHFHAPRPLHLAASTSSPAVVTALLIKGGADPTLTNDDGHTAFEIAGDRATRDAFRLARSELGETKWDWSCAKIPDALSKADVEKRTAAERAAEEQKEAARRKLDLERLQEEDLQREKERQSKGEARWEAKLGKGRVVSKTAEERREEEARGMTPEMRMKLGRERRARAAEERMRRMQGPS